MEIAKLPSAANTNIRRRINRLIYTISLRPSRNIKTVFELCRGIFVRRINNSLSLRSSTHTHTHTHTRELFIYYVQTLYSYRCGRTPLTKNRPKWIKELEKLKRVAAIYQRVPPPLQRLYPTKSTLCKRRVEVKRNDWRGGGPRWRCLQQHTIICIYFWYL